MRVTRVFVEQDLSVGSVLTLKDNTFQHIINVLRLTIGAQIILFNGNGYDYLARISRVEKKSFQVNLDERSENLASPKLPIHLAQCICRGEKMDFVIQKATELGVTTITPLFSEFGNVKLAGARLAKKLEHWQKVADSACEQTGRADRVLLCPAQLLVNFVNTENESLKLILTPGAGVATVLPTTADSVTLLVGPEGGFSTAEEQQALNTDFQAWQLGPRVFRSETAGLAAISVAQSRWGDFH